MREIKFRAWDGKSIFCPDWLDNTTNCDPYDDGGWNNPEGHYVDGEYPACILMQYTGLKDKNGKEIYERDIILYPDTYTESVDVGVGVGLKVAETEENSFGVVVFSGSSFCLECSGGETLGNGMHTFDWIYNWYGMEISDLEVIGNIYENPELLK